jgi:hypothetical protein
MTENQRLRELLKEARAHMFCSCATCNDRRARIDAALAEPVADCSRCETLRELADTAAAEQGLAQRRMMEAQKGRDEANRQIEDAIEAMVQRGEKRNCGNKPKSLLEMVGAVMHNFLNAKAALNDYKVVVVRVTQERDEARSEVEFLRGVGCNELDGTDVRGPCGACIKCARRERDEARAALAEAYRRGAEAMREQVASLFDGGQNVPGLMKSPEFRDFIRALPIPEDK